MCGAVELKLTHEKKYEILFYSDDLPSTDEPSFEQGSIVPRLRGAYLDYMDTKMPLFINTLAQQIAMKHDESVVHEFNLAFVPKKTKKYTQDGFFAAMSAQFSPLCLVIFTAPFLNFLTQALEEKVSSNLI